MNLFELAMMKKSGKGGVSSWNDLTDKPFGEEPGVEIMAEVALEYRGAGLVAVTVFGCPDFVVGKTYTVNFDGTPYSCVARVSGDGIVYLGNPIELGGEDTGEPFVAVHFPAGALEGSDQGGIIVQSLAYDVDYSGKIVSIYTAETIKTLDEKYLPESVKGTDTTLTQAGKAADAKAVGDAILNAIDSSTASAQIYLIDNDHASPITLLDFLDEKFGDDLVGTFDIKIVEELTSSNAGSNEPNVAIIYIIDSTGIVYVTGDEGFVTLGRFCFGEDGYDKGWTTNINSQTEHGVYCVRKRGGLSIKKITFTDRPTLYAWLQSNVGKLLKGVFTTNVDANPLVFNQVNAEEYLGAPCYKLFTMSPFAVINNSTVDHIEYQSHVYEIYSDHIMNYYGTTAEGGQGDLNTVPDEYWAQLGATVKIYYIEQL